MPFFPFFFIFSVRATASHLLLAAYLPYPISADEIPAELAAFPGTTRARALHRVCVSLCEEGDVMAGHVYRCPEGSVCVLAAHKCRRITR